MAEANKKFTAIHMDEKNPISVRHDLEEPFNEDFWLKVQEKFNSCTGISWNRAMDEVRTDRLITKHGRDTILVIIRDWPASKKYKEKPELVASLEYLISRFTEIILERDRDKEYKFYRVEEDPAGPTLLHLAAEQNFVHVAKLLVEKYPALVYLETEQMENKRGYLPVEKALMSYKDETAAYLISQMKHDWVYELFLYDDELNRAKFSFGHFISHKNLKTGQLDMTKTVNSVLDRLVNPHWPYLPEKTRELSETSDRIDLAWSSVPDDPLNYDFLYHLLEVDEQGRQPKIDEHTPNEMFNRNSVSCLRRIAESKDKKAIQHPVVRMLIMRKWNKFGHWWFCVQAAFYTLFLTVLSYALIYGSTQDDPTKYSGKANGLRLFCEVLTVIFLMFFFFEEVNEAEREWQTYFKDPYNYFDWLGLILTFLVIPLRLAKVKFQWSLAGLGYLFNFLRLFKFSCVSRTTGLYTKTLAKIIYRDMIRFGVVFFIVFLGFCGALFMILKATDNQDLFLSYGWLMLAAVRALVEQQPAEEDYSKFNWLAILIILAYMAMVIVILLNVLIAQLSDTYSEAKRNAKLQYSIDRMVIVTRLEHSRFARFNLRVKHYQEGDRVSETTLVKEMLEYNDERRPWETMEEKLSLIRNLMRRVVGKVSDKME
ncbi:transient receptor potential cation channel subfamily V member 4-like isoform X2 [Acropora palmata]|uniref:transient receptor potential cation channel subfamily V member 4-like isoform X2 n=1 Tax=Acropora palmata TaxID=6131 RepID=UPI003DA16115